MRTISIGDPVVMIEHWPNEQTGIMEPDTTTKDCRLYGVCSYIDPSYPNTITAKPYGSENIPAEDGLVFPLSLPYDAKPGTAVAFHESDATELYPIKTHP